MGRRRSATGVATAIASFAVSVACTSYRSDADPNVDAGSAIDGKFGAAGSGQYTGLPCDVQAVLENRCIGCHSGEAAPIPPLLDYGDLVATSSMDSAKTRAEIALDRMRGNTKPMPPAPASRADVDEIAAFDTWIKGGMAKNPTSCTPAPASPVGDPDAGSPSATLDASTEPSTCTSGDHWTQGDTGSVLMHPGGACITCHQQKGGPNYRFAGTVFGGLHDVDDCNGTSADGLFVVITGKNGGQQKIQVAPNGNFFSPVGMTPPFTVELQSNSKSRKMLGSVTAGDCNSCHTTQGKNGAPGRVLLP